MLTSRVVAYLNVDVAVSGAGFQAAATPQLDQLLMQATKQVLNKFVTRRNNLQIKIAVSKQRQHF